jgi:hypothetical protein
MKVGYQILEINDAPPKWAGYYLWSLFWGRESEKLVLGLTPKEHLRCRRQFKDLWLFKVKDFFGGIALFCTFFL